MPDPDRDRLDERLRAVERAITDTDRPPADVADAAEATDRIDGVERRVAEIEDRLADVEAATRALRGYVGNVRSVDRDVEQRAETALSVARRVEARLDDGRPPSEVEPSTANADRNSTETGDAGEWPTPWNAAGSSGGDTSGTTNSNTNDPDSNSRRSPASDGERVASAASSDKDRRSAEVQDHSHTETSKGTSRAEAPGENSAEIPGTETAVGDPEDSKRPGGAERNTTDRGSWGDAAWPGVEDPGSSGSRPDEDTWPPRGMDVDRAQPWSVPDPGEEEWDHGEETKGLLARVRETL